MGARTTRGRSFPSNTTRKCLHPLLILQGNAPAGGGGGRKSAPSTLICLNRSQASPRSACDGVAGGATAAVLAYLDAMLAEMQKPAAACGQPHTAAHAWVTRKVLSAQPAQAERGPLRLRPMEEWIMMGLDGSGSPNKHTALARPALLRPWDAF